MSVKKIPTRVRRVSEKLPVKLNDKERLQFADDMAEANQQVDNAKANKKSVIQSLNYEIEIAETRRERLSGIVSSKTEYRDVTVEEKWDYDEDRYSRTRTDTGEVVFERRLTDNEKQTELIDEVDEEIES